MLALLSLLLSVGRDARAEAYLGLGVAVGDAADIGRGSTAGPELRMGWQLRPRLALEAGFLAQHGDLDRHLPGVEGEDRQRWRALYVGPRLRHPIGSGWHASALLGLAHVDVQDEVSVLDVGTTPPTRLSQTLHRSTLGAVAALGISRDIGERQQLWLELRRVHAGLGRRCELVPFADCTHAAYQSSDGVSLGWSLRFR